MPYARVRIRKQVSRRIVSWNLSDFVFTEVRLRLEQTLPREAPGCLQRDREPFDGLVYRFNMIDPDDRFREHVFLFQVAIGTDEDTLWVINAGHALLDGI